MTAPRTIKATNERIDSIESKLDLLISALTEQQESAPAKAEKAKAPTKQVTFDIALERAIGEDGKVFRTSSGNLRYFGTGPEGVSVTFYTTKDSGESLQATVSSVEPKGRSLKVERSSKANAKRQRWGFRNSKRTVQCFVAGPKAETGSAKALYVNVG